jgi:DNA-binding transcriptional LysR family regulator
VPRALRSGHLDVALVHDYDYVPIEPDPALTTEPLLDETMYLASLTAPPVDDGPAILSARDASWILGSPDTLCHTVTVRACQASGFTPRVRHHVDDFVTVLALVAASQGVALIPMLAATSVPEGVILTALPARRRTHVAYRRGTGSNPAVAAFIAAVGASAASFLRRSVPPPCTARPFAP